MKKLLRAVLTALTSRALPPLVIGLFLLLYVGIAFGTDEALTVLMEFTRKSVFLAVLLGLLPLNSALRILRETKDYLARRRALGGSAADVPPGLFDEAVELPGSRDLDELQARLDAVGYKTHRGESILAAWRGVSLFPARILLLAGIFCLFAGILVSLTTRFSYRAPLIEGELLPQAAGGEDRVAKLLLTKSSGPFLDKTLAVTLAPSNGSAGGRTFGLYPPGLYGGSFVYPRYLGIAVEFHVSAPEAPGGYDMHCVPNIYPPGKEDSVEIPNSPYRIVLKIAEPGDGSDPFVTGRATFNFKLLKGKEIVLTGSAPSGGEFVGNGYRLTFPDSRRLAITDLIRDYGVFLIWAATIFFIVAGIFWLPVRMFVPRRELLFRCGPDVIHARSRAEGKRRGHAGVFHESLDLLDSGVSRG
ncbi:MAG: hypothetical protein P4L44_13685 [Oryzomonas sp.]|uniref:hypothetical protein n=1 Tax=Oryzomonas sp. TaxID=2855186 RepID=UPI00283AE245|nr:hypothetical protein [Oryzomonas sp.]MDR3581007.1 hypothetical protein [Oryzomonas sp.]